MTDEIKEESVSTPDDEWEKQEGAGVWLPKEEGDTLVGTIIGVQDGMYGNQYVIRMDDGNETLTPSHKVLQNRLTKAIEGDVVKIVFVEEEPPSVKGQNPTKIYDVFIKKA